VSLKKGEDIHVSVYGSPYDEGKEEFISKLHSLFLDTSLPTLVSGDFNLIPKRQKQWNCQPKMV
jgi:hypothetical protein